MFEILLDWVRGSRRIYTLGPGTNRYQLLAVEDLVDAIVLSFAASGVSGEVLNVGARELGTVRQDLQALIDHAGSDLRLTPVPVRPAELALRALELLRVLRSPSGTTRRRTRTPSSRPRRRSACSDGNRGSRMREL